MSMRDIYLCGDSHSNNFARVPKKLSGIYDVKYTTLGGYSVVSFMAPENSGYLRLAPESFQRGFKSYFLHQVPENSIIVFSGMDGDTRGMINENHSLEKVFSDYKEYYNGFIDYLRIGCRPRKLVMLDAYPVIPRMTTAQETSVETRVKLRKVILDIIKQKSQIDKFVSLVTTHGDPLLEKEDGTVLDESMLENPEHFEFSCKLKTGQTIADHLSTKIMREII